MTLVICWNSLQCGSLPNVCVAIIVAGHFYTTVAVACRVMQAVVCCYCFYQVNL